MTISAINAVGSPARLAWALLWRYWVHSLWIWIPIAAALGLLLTSWVMGSEGISSPDPAPIYITFAILRFVANLGVGLIATMFALRGMNGKVFGKSAFDLINQAGNKIRPPRAPEEYLGVTWNIGWRFVLPVDALWAFSILVVMNLKLIDAAAFYGLGTVFYENALGFPVGSKVNFYVYAGLVLLMTCLQFLILIWVFKSQHLKNIGGSAFMTATMQNDEASADAD